MGTWPRRTYVQYVETHAQARDIVPLQFPYDEPLDHKNPKIFLSYFSMPFWMDTLDIAFGDREATFRRITPLFAHRHAHACQNRLAGFASLCICAILKPVALSMCLARSGGRVQNDR
jgi:hypothetical protein